MIFNVGCDLWSAQPRLRCFFMECGGMTPQAQPRLRTPKIGDLPPHSINE